MRVAAVQFTSTEDVAANVARATDLVRQAADRGARLVVLPEFFNTIFFAQYRDKAHFDLAEPADGRTLTAIREAASRHGVDIVATLYEEAAPGLHFDTAFHVTAGGDVLHTYRKVHPAGVLSLEKLYFRYGTVFGTYAFEAWRVGIGICYDMAFPETARSLAANGAELIIAPYATSRRSMFQELLRTRAFENGCYLLAANKVGREGDWTLSGHSMIAAPDGTLLASAGDEDGAVILADLDRAAVRRARIDFPTVRDRRPELYGALTRPVDGPDQGVAR